MPYRDQIWSPVEMQAAVLAGVPPEVLVLREMLREAEADVRRAQRRLAAIMFALRQDDLMRAAEALDR